jgi:xanthine/uracil/vitamin C permease (AzgA family)
MESLALLVTLMLAAVFGSGLIAVISSWSRNRATEIITYIFSAISILAGIGLGFSLRDGNGFAIAVIPISLGILAVWNVKRRKQLPAEPASKAE